MYGYCGTMLYGWRLRLSFGYVAILVTRDLLRAMHFGTGNAYFPTGTDGHCSDYTSDMRGATGYSQVFLYMFFLLDFKRGEEGECGQLG
jgi:hypothetical protein